MKTAHRRKYRALRYRHDGQKGQDNMKMCELFTGYYSDRRTAYEKPLEWIYANQNGARVVIRPCIWLWKTSAGLFLVDYVGDGIGCTCGSFDTYREADKFAETLAQMEQAEFETWLLNKWKSA